MLLLRVVWCLMFGDVCCSFFGCALCVVRCSLFVVCLLMGGCCLLIELVCLFCGSLVLVVVGCWLSMC